MSSDNQVMGKSLAIGGAWALFANIFTAIAGILHTAILSRILTPAELGTYFLIASVVMFLGIPSNFGMPDVAVRTISKEIGAGHINLAQSFIKKSFTIATLSSLFVFIIMISGAGSAALRTLFGIEATFVTTVLIAGWTCLIAFHALITESIRGLNDIKNASLFGALLKNVMILIAFTTTWVLSDNVTLNLVLTAVLIAIVITTGLSTYAFLKNLNSKTEGIVALDADGKTYAARNLTALALPFLLNALTAYILVRIGLWVVGYYLPKDEVAIFGACIQLVLIVVIPLTIINAILPPLISNLFFNAKNSNKLQSILRTCTTIAGIPSIVALLIFSLYGSSILSTVFGPAFSAGATVLTAFAIGQCTNMLVGPTGTVMKMTDNQSLLLKVNISAGIITTAFSIIAAKYYGLNLTAIVFGASMALKNFYMHYLVKKHVGVTCGIYYKYSEFKSLYRNVANIVMQIRKSL
jgi:O-antigen/teichoic acid export membrane protein